MLSLLVSVLVLAVQPKLVAAQPSVITNASALIGAFVLLASLPLLLRRIAGSPRVLFALCDATRQRGKITESSDEGVVREWLCFAVSDMVFIRLLHTPWNTYDMDEIQRPVRRRSSMRRAFAFSLHDGQMLSRADLTVWEVQQAQWEAMLDATADDYKTCYDGMPVELTVADVASEADHYASIERQHAHLTSSHPDKKPT